MRSIRVSVSLLCGILAADESAICSVRSVRNPFTIRDDRSTTAVINFCVSSGYIYTCRPIDILVVAYFSRRPRSHAIVKLLNWTFHILIASNYYIRFDLLKSKIASKKTHKDVLNLNIRCHVLYLTFMLAYKSIGDSGQCGGKHFFYLYWIHQSVSVSMCLQVTPFVL